VRCGFCDLELSRPALHAHLTDEHGDRVTTEQDGWGRSFLELRCPACDERYRSEIKPRLRDPGFVAEYAREIRIVAFDMFLYHWASEHEQEEVGGG